MGQWLVTQNDEQFSVQSLSELQRLAEDGRLSGGDMVQPPGASEWMYALEIPELASSLNDTMATDEDLDFRPRGSNGLLAAIAALFMLTVIVGSVTVAGLNARLLLTDSGTVVGDGGLSYTELLVTQPGAALRSAPDANASAVITLDKDSKLELLSKRGNFYRARAPMGQEGWVETRQVVAAYKLAGGDVERTYDPLYNPDDYIFVSNANWLQLDRSNTQLTVFRFQMENEAQYTMTDLVLLVTIKDGNGSELERLEVAVDGIIPAGERSFVGTLHPDPNGDDPEAMPKLLTAYSFQQMAEDDPDLQLRYTDGVEVEMASTDFTAASVNVLEVRAIPPE